MKNKRHLLLGIFVVSGAIALRYGWSEEPLKIVESLNSMQTKRIVAGVAVMSLAAWIYLEIKKQ